MPNKSLTLTLVIPVYNEEDYLPTCLKAIARQTVKPDEVLVVDNNSTDGTAKLAKKFKFVKLISEPRQGVSNAVERGFGLAKGEIIGRIDADTILPPNWIANVNTLLKDDRLAAVTGPVGYYDMPFSNTNYFFDHKMRQLTSRFAPENPFIFGSNMAIRKSSWRKIAGELCDRQDIHEDIDIAVHLYLNGYKILYSPVLLAMASGRRYNDKPAKFIRYMAMYRRTFTAHGLHSLAVYPALFMWCLGYVCVHPWLGLWYKMFANKQTRFPYSDKVRKNPMER
jgi:glycosyltransferase involved in cell wall biosynthesis